jgi:hypothetical protein
LSKPKKGGCFLTNFSEKYHKDENTVDCG